MPVAMVRRFSRGPERLPIWCLRAPNVPEVNHFSIKFDPTPSMKLSIQRLYLPILAVCIALTASCRKEAEKAPENVPEEPPKVSETVPGTAADPVPGSEPASPAETPESPGSNKAAEPTEQTSLAEPAKPASAASAAETESSAEPNQAGKPARDAETAKHEAIVAEKLEPYECGEIARLHTFQGIFLASQPSPADFEQARKGGVKTVINIRHPEEIKEFDEAKVVADLGLAYHNPAWNGPEELTDAVFDELRGLLRTVEKPILFHCSSANRVGAIWLAYRVLDDGLGVEDALVEAKTVGLKSPDYEARAKAYIQRNQEPSTN